METWCPQSTMNAIADDCSVDMIKYMISKGAGNTVEKLQQGLKNAKIGNNQKVMKFFEEKILLMKKKEIENTIEELKCYLEGNSSLEDVIELLRQKISLLENYKM